MYSPAMQNRFSTSQRALVTGFARDQHPERRCDGQDGEKEKDKGRCHAKGRVRSGAKRHRVPQGEDLRRVKLPNPHRIGKERLCEGNVNTQGLEVGVRD